MSGEVLARSRPWNKLLAEERREEPGIRGEVTNQDGFLAILVVAKHTTAN
jgi:hypothetical protein